MSSFLRQLFAYGLTTALSYVVLTSGTYLLSRSGYADPLTAYAFLLALVYVGVFYSYAHFVFKTGVTRAITRRFIVFLLSFWVINNSFFWLLHVIAGVPYPIVIALNLIVLGGVRFFVQRHFVFQATPPEQKRAGLSFDVELWHEGEWMQPYIKANKTDGEFRRSITDVLTILKQYRRRATFFVTAQIVTDYPDLVTLLATEGHEIGIHGTSHTRLHDIADREAYRRDLQALITQISALTGTPPKGFRAPHFSLDHSTQWILPMLAELGFVYDSSLFPIPTPEYGISGAPKTPYRVSFSDLRLTDSTSMLIEVPVTIGGVYARLLPLSILRLLLSVISSVPILYFHPHELAAYTPRIRGPKLRTLLKYWGTQNAFRKFEHLCMLIDFDRLDHVITT